MRVLNNKSNLRQVLTNNKIVSLCILLSLLVTLSPLHGVGYLIFVFSVATKLDFLDAFRSYFSRIAISILLLTVSIMIGGVFTSLLDIPNFALLNLVFAYTFCVIIYLLQEQKPNRRAKFDASDTISLIAAIAVPVIILSIHFFHVLPLTEVLFKIVNADGWDGVSHLNFLQVTAENNNYFYSTSPMTEGSGIAAINYPQGWHLASSSFVNGLIPGIFNPLNYGVNAMFIAYISTILCWYSLVVFVFGKTVWYLAYKLKTPSQIHSRYVIFLSVMLIPIFTLFVVNLSKGYLNYLGVFPFVIVAVSGAYQVLSSKNTKGLWAYLAFALLMSAGVCLEWVLPVPFIALLILMVLLTTGVKLIDILKRPPIVALAMIVAAAIFGYLYILTLDVGVSQFYASNSWSASLPSVTLGAVCLSVVIFDMISRRSKADTLIIIISPFFVYILVLWLFAYLFNGGIGYYHAKLFGILFSVILLFTCAALIRLVESVSIPLNRAGGLIMAGMISLSSVAGVIVLSGQSIDVKMFQRSLYYLNPEELSYASKWMTSENSLKKGGQLLLMRNNILNNKNNSMLYNRLTVDSAKRYLASQSPSTKRYIQNKYTCLMNIYYERRGDKVVVLKREEDVLNKLAVCVKERTSAGLPTTIRLPVALKKKIMSIDISSANLVYYVSINNLDDNDAR